MAINNLPDLFTKDVFALAKTDNQVNFDYVTAYERGGYDNSEYNLVQINDLVGAINEYGKLMFAVNDLILSIRLKENRLLKVKVKKLVHCFPDAHFCLEVKEIPSSLEIDYNGLVRGFIFGDDESFDIIEKMGELATYGAKYRFRPYSDNLVKAVLVDDPSVSITFRCIALYEYAKKNVLVYGTLHNITSGFPIEVEFQIESYAKSESEPTRYYEPHYEINYSIEPNRHFGRIFKDGNFSSRVVGLKYREDYDALQKYIQPGDIVQISLDPDNQFDEDALKVTKDGIQIGYIAKMHKPAVLLFIKKKQIEAEIEYLNFDEDYIDIRISPNQNDFLQKYIKKYGIHFMKIEKVKRGYEYTENMCLIAEDEFKGILK